MGERTNGKIKGKKEWKNNEKWTKVKKRSRKAWTNQKKNGIKNEKKNRRMKKIKDGWKDKCIKGKKESEFINNCGGERNYKKKRKCEWKKWWTTEK